MDMGRDNGGVVDLAYEERAPYAFTGTLKKVTFDLKPAHFEAEQDLHAQHAGAGPRDRGRRLSRDRASVTVG